MPRSSLVATVVLSLVALCTSPAPAVTFSENFDDGLLDPDLSITMDPGFSGSLVGGQLVFEKAGGTGNGTLRVRSTFMMSGDFDFTVWADRTNLAGLASMGAAVDDGVGGFADPYFRGTGQVIANIFFPTPPGFGSQLINDSSSPVTFRMRRTGATMSMEYDSGGGFQVIHSATDASLTGPLAFSLFLIQDTGSTVAESGAFDDLVVTADAFIFPTTTTTTTTTSTATSTTTTSVPPVDARFVPGKKLLLTQKKSGAQRLQLMAKDTSLAPATPCEVDGELVVQAVGAGAAAQRFALDASSWKPIKAKKPERGCKYRKGPVASTVLVKTGKSLKLVASAPDLGIPLGADPSPVRVEVRHGDARYCFEFGGQGNFKLGKKLLAKDAPAATACPSGSPSGAFL